MASSTLPRHPRSGLRALGYRRNGAPIWPILGGSEPNGEPVSKGEPAPSADESFPANTPWQDMTPGQQVNYWKHQARRHESRAKAFGDLTPDAIAELREKAARADALDEELMSDRERAVREAAENSRYVAEAEFLPRLINAEFRAAAAGRIEPERLAAILEPLDLSKFLTDQGDIDTDKVSAFLDGVAPAKGTETPPQRRGPSTDGLGRRESTATAASVAAGRELYRSRHPQKTT